VTNPAANPATERAESHELVNNCTNQVHSSNVHRRMFHHLLVVCQGLPGRVQALATKRPSCRKLTTKWLRPRRTTGIVLTMLFSVTLAHRTGVLAPLMDWQVPFGLSRVWKATEHEVIRLRNRAREDYQTLWLAYCLTRQLRSLQEQPAGGEQQTKRHGEQCRVTEFQEPIKGSTPCPVVPTIARNRLPGCFRLTEGVRE